jgi:spectinomycin phosphotransferase
MRSLFFISYTTFDHISHERIVQDIVEYGQALLLTSGGGEDRLEMYKDFMDMFEANGVVDIVFKTDEELALGVEKNG